MHSIQEYIGFCWVPILFASLQYSFKLASFGNLQDFSFNIEINSGLQIMHSYIFFSSLKLALRQPYKSL